MGSWLDLISPITSIVNKLIPDKAAQAAAEAQLKALVLSGQLNAEMTQLTAITTAQSDVDKAEAGSTNLFVSGWRPAIGWVCGLALFAQYILRPLVQWGFSVTGHPVPTLPGLDDNLWQLMFGMLGMGTLRTIDKIRGVASK